jgi:hypothetical protein
MLATGRIQYRYFDNSGLAVDLAIGSYPDHYRATVVVNGAPSRTVKRRDFDSAVRWARSEADDQLSRFGVQPRQLPLPFADDIQRAPHRAMASVS